jgi:hypothetical protein
MDLPDHPPPQLDVCRQVVGTAVIAVLVLTRQFRELIGGFPRHVPGRVAALDSNYRRPGIAALNEPMGVR